MKLRSMILVFFIGFGACALAAEPVWLTYASQYSPHHPFSRADQEWIDFVESESNGTIRIRAIWSGGLLSSSESMTELRHGVADVGLITPIYANGGAHLIRVQAGFYSGVTSIENQVALYHCLAANFPQFAVELEGLKVLAVQGGNLPGIIMRERPVRTLSDLEGMRVRAPTELLEVLKTLGADPVSMPMADVYSSLAKGIIDGVLAPTDTFRSLHFAEVANYFTSLEIPRGAYPARAMSWKRWQSLSPDAQAILDRSSAVWEAALATRLREATQSGTEYAVEMGVQFSSIDPAEQRRFETLYENDVEHEAKRLDRFGIDGLAVLAAARASISDNGEISCSGSN